MAKKKKNPVKPERGKNERKEKKKNGEKCSEESVYMLPFRIKVSFLAADSLTNLLTCNESQSSF